MRVLLISSLTRNTGNETTAHRFKQHFENGGHVVTLADPTSSTAMATGQAEFIVAIHAFRCRTILLETDKPYVLVLGGTDVNLDVANSEKLEIVQKVVRKALHAISFTQDMKDRLVQVMPGIGEKITVLAAAITVSPSPTFRLRPYLGLPENACIAILPTGIRPVKDVLFLVDVISAWHAIDSTVYLAIIGPVLDEAYAEQVRQRVSRCGGGVCLAGAVSSEEMHAAVRDSQMLVNCSLSEGMSNALLEAMALHVPVIVRNIPGNTAVISDGVNGMVYSSPDEFVSKAKRLLASSELCARLASKAFEYIQEHHCPQKEAAVLNGLLRPP